MLTIHMIGHLRHYDIGPGLRHVLIRRSEETGTVDIRIIDFDHATDHEC